MRGGQMRPHGRVASLPAPADVGHHAPVLEEDLDRRCAEPDFDLLAP